MSNGRKIKLRIRSPLKTVTLDLTYLAENPGAPFIIAFQVLLCICAVMLAIGREQGANALAVYAYYSLIAGVVLQLVSTMKQRRKRVKGEETK